MQRGTILENKRNKKDKYHSRINECEGDSDWHVFGHVLLASNTVIQPQFYHRNPLYADSARIIHCMGSMSFLTECIVQLQFTRTKSRKISTGTF